MTETAQPELSEGQADQLDAQAVGEHIERILDELAGIADERVSQRATELVRMLMSFYGSGLRRILEVLHESPAGAELLDELAADDLVGSQLVLHDLHPRSTVERVTEALDSIRPYLGSHAGDVELIGIDDDGVLRLRLKGTCDGCPSSTVTVKYAIEKAVNDAAPEITDIDVAGMATEEDTGPGGRPLLPLQTAECPVPEAS